MLSSREAAAYLGLLTTEGSSGAAPRPGDGGAAPLDAWDASLLARCAGHPGGEEEEEEEAPARLVQRLLRAAVRPCATPEAEAVSMAHVRAAEHWSSASSSAAVVLRLARSTLQAIWLGGIPAVCPGAVRGEIARLALRRAAAGPPGRAFVRRLLAEAMQHRDGPVLRVLVSVWYCRGRMRSCPCQQGASSSSAVVITQEQHSAEVLRAEYDYTTLRPVAERCLRDGDQECGDAVLCLAGVVPVLSPETVLYQTLLLAAQHSPRYRIGPLAPRVPFSVRV